MHALAAGREAYPTRLPSPAEGVHAHRDLDPIFERASGDEFRAQHVGDADILLGVISRVEHQKAPDLLVDALELIPDPLLRRLRVVWVGPLIDTELAASVESRLAGSALDGRVEFIGETRDTRSVYLGVDGILLCSRWEGLPNVVLEALAHGRPVIVTNVGDTGKLVRDGSWGWLVPPDDARSFAEALTKLVATPRDELNAMGQRGSEFVLENYSTSRLVDRTMDVYRAVMGPDWP